MERILPTTWRGQYQWPDSALTLREGLTEYYEVNPGLANPETIDDPVSAAYFRNHDATHVFFGTHTGVHDEIINDLWTAFGVDLPYGEYIRGFFATHESTDIAKMYMNVESVVAMVHGLTRIPELWSRARRMNRRWPWKPDPSYYDRPLVELRAEFGLQLPDPPQA